MTDLATLTTQLAALQDVRSKGVSSLSLGNGEQVSYRSDAELSAAISELERRIAAAQGRTFNQVRFSTSKGL